MPPLGTPGGSNPPNKTRLYLILAAALALGIAWILAIVAFGGPDEQADASSPDPGSTTADPRPKPDPYAPPAGDPETPSREPLYRDDPHSPGGSPGDEQADEQDDEPIPEPAIGGKAEPSIEDPLGTGASPDALSQKHKDRAKKTASDFVVFAYGYTGDDAVEYTEKLNTVVVTPEFHSSPGAKAVVERLEAISSVGLKARATLQDFQIGEEALDKTTGVAYFSVNDSQGEARYTQRLELKKWGETWRVLSAEPLAPAGGEEA